MDSLAADEDTDVTALTRGTEPLPADATLGQVLRMLDSGLEAVPIADLAGLVVGWVRHRDVLTALMRSGDERGPAGPHDLVDARTHFARTESLQVLPFP